jgi:hypothetical protein
MPLSQLRALLSSRGMSLPNSDAAALRYRDLLAGGCLETARNTTFEQLVGFQKVRWAGGARLTGQGAG